MRKVFTLGIYHTESNVLLGFKKEGWGAGRWNGFGGKVKNDESIDEAFAREFLEESMAMPLAYEKRGIMQFSFEDKPETIAEMHIYNVEHVSGAVQETSEMRPQWFPKNEYHEQRMWNGDRLWMPLLLEGKFFTGSVHYKSLDDDTVLFHDIRVVDRLEPKSS